MGVSCGGLGLRTALGVALPAFVENRILCRPLVSTMVDHFSAAFGTPSKLIKAEYDTRTDEAPTRLVSTLPSAAVQMLERELLWRNVLSGTDDAMRDQPTPSLRHARGITLDDGDGDDEHLARKPLKIQAPITACVDTGVHQELLQMHWNEAPGAPTCGFWSSAPRRLTTPGCGSSTSITAP